MKSNVRIVPSSEQVANLVSSGERLKIAKEMPTIKHPIRSNTNSREITG